MSTGEWLDQLTAAEEHLIPADLRRAAEFLWSARNSGEGWGDYPKVPTDLQVTAQVIGALQILRHPKTGELVTSVAAWAKHYLDRPAATIQDAIGLLALATADQDIDGRYPEELRSTLRTALTHLDSDRVSTVTLAQAVLATESWSDEHKKWAQPWVDELVRRGQGADAWHKAGLPEESLPVTSLAVRALAPWKHRHAVEVVVQCGLEHLRSHLLGDGWESRALSGTYALTLVLRALATDPDCEPQLSEEGLDLLRSRQRSDGGWTGGEQERGSSSVEHTAAAVTALTEYGVCRYVPLLATRSVIRQLTTSLDEVTKRQAALEEDIDGQVEERLGRAITERQQLRRRLQERESELKRLRRRVDETESLSETLPDKRSSLTRRWLPLNSTVMAMAASLLVVLITFRDSIPRLDTPFSAIMSTVIGIIIVFGPLVIFGIFTNSTRKSVSESVSAKRARRFVDDFMDATEDLPASVREELVYRLAREGADLPSDLFLRFLTELTSKHLRIDRDTDRRLRSWMEEFARVEPQERRALIARLRRIIL